MKSKTLGSEGFAGAVVLTIGLALLQYFFASQRNYSVDFGVCLPSPNNWALPELWSWGINYAMIIGSGVALIFFNKGYSVIQSADMVLPSMFLMLTATNPWAGGALGSSSLMVMINLFCLATIFSCYKSFNATQEVFVVATMLSVGSMFQYAFIFLMPAYIVIGLLMQCFRWKECAAFLMGIAAPYWCGIGLGLIPLDQFSIPNFTTVWENTASAGDIFTGVLSIGITAVIASILTLNNSVKLYAGNTQRRLYNNSIAIIGLVCIAGLAFDFSNLPTYLATFYMTVAFTIGSTFSLYTIRKPGLWLGIITAIYLIFFLVMIF
ncbi:MAG: hypothetical protein K2M45_05485 [Muribaculaceae bacterium]|nr:hypothetical protein [Muribaculaceae bacterium]